LLQILIIFSPKNFYISCAVIFQGHRNQHERRQACKDTQGDLKRYPQRRQVYLLQAAYGYWFFF